MNKYFLTLVLVAAFGLLTVASAYSARTEAPPDIVDDFAAAGCAAFPIAIHEGVRSVTPPGVGANPYPNPGEFTYPPLPPTYQSFTNHLPDMPLTQAREGFVYKVQNDFSADNLVWLVWNVGINASVQTLANSLTWPGNSTDYTDHGDAGTILPGFSHVVRGYVEPVDLADTSLHLGDWVELMTGSINSIAVKEAINEHVDLGHTLRLLVWDENLDTGSSGRYRIAAFALFRIHGYTFSQSSGGGWLLLEFVKWDTSCGQPIIELESVAISGPNTGLVNTSYTFTSEVTPLNATQPISYTWESTGDPPIVLHTGGLSDTVVFTWPTEGTHNVTVTAENAAGTPVVNTHSIDIEGLQQIYVPVVFRE